MSKKLERENVNYCIGFAFGFNPDEILLIEKIKPKWQEGRLNGLGGKIEKDENPNQAMTREFKEECGIYIQEDKWKHKFTINYSKSKVYFFTTSTKKIKQAKSLEKEKVAIYDCNNLPKNILWPLSWQIPLSKARDIKFPIEFMGDVLWPPADELGPIK